MNSTEEADVPSDEPHSVSSAADERRTQLIELVERQGFCTIGELSAAFDVSDMTIRRDVRMLVHNRQLRSVHGGVTVLPQNAMVGTDFRARAARMSAAKRAIALRAIELVPRSGAIALDAGTTTLELANYLPTSSTVKVVTPSLAVVNALVGREHLDVICLGGTLHSSTQSFAGPATVAAISELQVRTLFLAASGVRAHGVYCGNDFDAVTKRALISVADEVVLLTDSSKFTISAMVRACALSDLNRVITDDEVTDDQLEMFKDLDVEVIVASTATTATTQEDRT